MLEFNVECDQSLDQLIALGLHLLVLLGWGEIVFRLRHRVGYAIDAFFDCFHFSFCGIRTNMEELLVQFLTRVGLLEVIVSSLEGVPCICHRD